MPSRTTRRRFLAAAGAATAGLAGCVAGPSRRDLDTRATDLFRANLGRQGYRDERVPRSVEREWRLPGINTGEHTAAKASPLPTPEGDLIVPGDTGVVQRVTPDGEVVWRAATDPAVRGIHGTPAIANGTVYVGAYDGALYAFDLETGIREWKTKLGDAIGASPAYRDGLVYIAVEYYAPSGSVFAVDAATGRVVHEDDRPTNHPHSSPAIDPDAGRLVVGANDGFLYAWEFPSMAFAWSFETGDAIKGPIATYDGAAFFGSWDHRIYRVDLATGEEEWSFEAGNMVMAGPGIDRASDTVFVGSHDDHLHAIDATTGEERWSFETGGWLLGCPAVTPEHVLVGSYDRHCYCLAKDTGEERWRAEATGWVTSTPLVHDGAVYFTDRATPDRPGGLYKLSSV